MMRLAVLSNVNADYIAMQLEKNFDVCLPQGYGDIWGQLLNEGSSVSRFHPQAVILIADISQLLGRWQDVGQGRQIIDGWFGMYEKCRKGSMQYLISDVKFREAEISDLDEFMYDTIEHYWKEKLHEMTNRYSNTHYLRLGGVACGMGLSGFYSGKAWYLGKMPYSRRGGKALAELIAREAMLLGRTPKKVLALDLDNTLWGGILGECGLDGIQLSDEKMGAVYRDAQLAVKKMQRRGTLLAICSKNNESDVQEVWDRHPHMALEKGDFAACRIGWGDKADSLRSLSEELNIGLDAFVFVDDMPAERENIRCRLPMVTVPEFPDAKEDIPGFFCQIYLEHFRKARATREDLVKTRQYQENRMREAEGKGMDYDSFLEGLGLCAGRVAYQDGSKERILQLIHKTNQFNLTLRRYSQQELDGKVAAGWEVYAYRALDKFGDYGIVAVAIVNPAGPTLDSFLMSCRVMGKQMENYFIDQVEGDLLRKGIVELRAEFVAGARNAPVRNLYQDLGYKVVEQDSCHSVYKINLTQRPQRRYHVTDLGRQPLQNGRF